MSTRLFVTLVLLFSLGVSCERVGRFAKEAPEGGAHAEPGSADRFRDALKPMPWYDRARDDYRTYDQETVAKHVPEERPKAERPAPPAALPAGFLQIFAYAFLAVLVLALLVFVVRVLHDRARPRAKPEVRTDVVHLPAFEQLAGDVPLEEGALARQIEATLESDPMRAAVLMFLFALLAVSRAGHLRDLPQSTAREAVRQLERSAGAATELKEQFRALARHFERALYGRTAPDEPLRARWAFWKTEAVS